MLSDDMSMMTFIERFRKRQAWNITKAMMNQSTVAGIGNYVKAEALWLSEISPLRAVKDLLDAELALLYEAARAVMWTSYENDGATVLAHKEFSSISGNYSSGRLCYNRKIDAEGNPVIKTSTPDGRTTHWVPQKQK